ncbi:MAG: hypothetical protein HZC19_02580 [Candidatus Omnitrophica bacterium]|nr:hypothetical protein [Candidatus Omnitrophota bacterium]
MRSIMILTLALIVFAFLYFSFFSRFDIIAADEGYFNLACFRIMNGELPYRDFFLHTPPLSYYLQACIFKIFGPSFFVGRLTMAVVGVFIVMLLVLISLRLAVMPYPLLPGLLFTFWGVSHIPYPSFNWYGLLSALTIIPVIFKFTDSGDRRCLMLTGLLTTLLCLTKQNLGAAAILSLAFYIVIYRFFNDGRKFVLIKDIFLDYIFIGLGASLATIPVMLFFYMNGALKDLVYYLFNFSYAALKMRMEAVPFPHLKISTFLILGIYLLFACLAHGAIIKKRFKGLYTPVFIAALGTALFYKFASKDTIIYVVDHIKEGLLNGFFNLPALFILLAAYFSVRKAFKMNTLDKTDLCLVCMVIFSFFYIWFGLIIARDMIHLIPTMAISYGFFGYFLNRLRKVITAYYFIFPVFFFCLFGLIMNINNETFRSSSSRLTGMNYRMKSDRAKFLVVERSKGSYLDEMTDYIISNTRPEERIFAFHIDSSIYILADKMPGTFNTFFLADAFRREEQKRVIEDLVKNNVKLIACDKRTYDSWYDKQNFDREGLTSAITGFLHDNFEEVETFGPYNILVKK